MPHIHIENVHGIVFKEERRLFFIVVNESGFQYNVRASGVGIYLDTEAMSLSHIYIVRLVVAKGYRNGSAYQSQLFFYTFRRVLSF